MNNISFRVYWRSSNKKEKDVEEDIARIEQFLDALWLERNLAENTLTAYRQDLMMVVAWLHHRGLTLLSMGEEDLQSLLAERQEGATKRPVMPGC